MNPDSPARLSDTGPDLDEFDPRKQGSGQAI